MVAVALFYNCYYCIRVPCAVVCRDPIDLRKDAPELPAFCFFPEARIVCAFPADTLLVKTLDLFVDAGILA